VLSVVRVCMHVYGCVCVRAATVAVVKSRDMHWGLLAQKDHKEVNLSTLRMLLVADGANPCELHVTISQCLSCLFSDLLTSNHRPRLNGCQPEMHFALSFLRESRSC